MASQKSSAASWLEYGPVLDRVVDAVRDVLGSGRVPDQIPAIADADPHSFGLAVATVEGELHASDHAVASSEAEHGHRNAALAHFLASYGNLENPVGIVLDHYVRHCAIAMSCAELALAGGFLARHGVRRDGSRFMSRSDAKRINAIMLTCGTYDAAGEFAYRVGVPAKSGVAGGILAIIPGRCSLCVWSPGLDDKGNSIAGIAALDAFTTLTGWSVF